MNQQNYNNQQYNNSGYKGSSHSSSSYGAGGGQGGKRDEKGNYSFLISFKKRHIFFLSLFGSLLLAFVFVSGFALAELVVTKNDSATQNSQQFANGMPVDGHAFAVNANANIENNKNTPKQKTSNIVFENSIDSSPINTAVKRNKPKSSTTPLASTKHRAADIKVQEVSKAPVANANSYEKQPQAGVEYYFLQVVVTADVEKAKIIAAKLRTENFLAVVHKKEMSKIRNMADNPATPINNNPVYVVRVGLYKNKTTALHHLSLLQDYAGFKDAFIRAYKA